MTNAELAILSLIREQPRHGYEIEQVIEERGMRDWTEVSFSSIYYLLKKLERKGQVESALRQSSQGATRRVYQLTPAGREALTGGVLEALSIPQPSYPPLQLGLSNLPGIPPTEAVAALRRYRDTLREQLEHIQSRRQAQQPLPYFVEAMFDYSVTMTRAELGWIMGFIRQLEEQADPTEGPAGGRRPKKDR